MIDHKLGFLFGYKPLPNKIYTRLSKCDLLSEINSPWAGNKLITSSGLEEITYMTQVLRNRRGTGPKSNFSACSSRSSERRGLISHRQLACCRIWTFVLGVRKDLRDRS